MLVATCKNFGEIRSSLGENNGFRFWRLFVLSTWSHRDPHLLMILRNSQNINMMSISYSLWYQMLSRCLPVSAVGILILSVSRRKIPVLSLCLHFGIWINRLWFVVSRAMVTVVKIQLVISIEGVPSQFTIGFPYHITKDSSARFPVVATLKRCGFPSRCSWL